MIEPKIFYRELDSVLSKIREEKSDKNFFSNILILLEKKFGPDLRIYNSHIFEKRGEQFVLINSSDAEKSKGLKEILSCEMEWIDQIIQTGTRLDSGQELLESLGLHTDPIVTVAAIHVHNPVRRWLFLFELEEGYSHEEITLFLNAMRTALNYRLFSDMMRSDLRQAEQIQKSLLPKVFPKIKGYDMYAYSQPADLVGGDFYDFVQFDEHDFTTSIGDVSGHGLPAALLVRDVVVGLRMGLAKEMRLVHTVKKLNQVIQQSTYSTNFVSIFVGEIETGGHLFYVNAGHPPPFLISGDRIQELHATGITLGFMPEIDLQRAYCLIDPQSVLVLYSDGIVERQNGEEEQFEVARLKRLVQENRQKSCREIVNLVYDAVFDFGNRTPWEDDATLVVIKRLE